MLEYEVQVDHINVEDEEAPTKPETTVPPVENSKGGGNWLIWTSIIGIVVIILFGGLYFLSLQKTSSETQTTNESVTPTPQAKKEVTEVDQQAANLKKVSQEDTPSALSKDILNTDLTGIDREMDQIGLEADSN